MIQANVLLLDACGACGRGADGNVGQPGKLAPVLAGQGKYSKPLRTGDQGGIADVARIAAGADPQ